MKPWAIIPLPLAWVFPWGFPLNRSHSQPGYDGQFCLGTAGAPITPGHQRSTDRLTHDVGGWRLDSPLFVVRSIATAAVNRRLERPDMRKALLRGLWVTSGLPSIFITASRLGDKSGAPALGPHRISFRMCTACLKDDPQRSVFGL